MTEKHARLHFLDTFRKLKGHLFGFVLLLAPTIVTTIEVLVDELWRTTVTTTPIINAATGLLISELSPRSSPAFCPANSRNELPRISSAQMKKYRKPTKKTPLRMLMKIRVVFCPLVISTRKSKLWQSCFVDNTVSPGFLLLRDPFYMGFYYGREGFCWGHFHQTVQK